LPAPSGPDQAHGRTPRGCPKTFQPKAREFVLEVYRLTESFPQRELYGLSHQMRRAAVSIPANIAEGFRKRGVAEKTPFMNIAEGSVEECRYYLILAKDLGYGDTAKLTALLEEVSRPTERLHQSHSDSWLLTPDFLSQPGTQLACGAPRDIKGSALA